MAVLHRSIESNLLGLKFNKRCVRSIILRFEISMIL